MTLWVLISRSFVNEFRLSRSIAGVPAMCILTLLSSYCSISQTPSTSSSLLLTSTSLILNSPQSEAWLWFHCKFFDDIIMNLLFTKTPRDRVHTKLSQLPDGPSSTFKSSPCSASYSLLSSSLLCAFWLLPLSIHWSPCTLFFFTMLSSVRHSAWEITPLLLHKRKALKNLRWENLGCLLFQRGLRHSRILWNIV